MRFRYQAARFVLTHVVLRSRVPVVEVVPVDLVAVKVGRVSRDRVVEVCEA
jgi:hypothetical protein